MRLRGVVVALAYRFSRHRFLSVPWVGWLILLPVALAVAMAFGGMVASAWAIMLAALSLVCAGITSAAGRGGFVAFQPSLHRSPVLREALSPGVRVSTRATGCFDVNQMRRCYAWVSGSFATFETREHVVMVHLKRTRFLLLGQSPKEEVGWWYTFFRPEQLLQVTPGELVFGLQRQPGLQLRYRSDLEKPVAVLHLAFDDELKRDRVWDDLVRDAPQARM